MPFPLQLMLVSPAGEEGVDPFSSPARAWSGCASSFQLRSYTQASSALCCVSIPGGLAQPFQGLYSEYSITGCPDKVWCLEGKKPETGEPIAPDIAVKGRLKACEGDYSTASSPRPAQEIQQDGRGEIVGRGCGKRSFLSSRAFFINLCDIVSIFLCGVQCTPPVWECVYYVP